MKRLLWVILILLNFSAYGQEEFIVPSRFLTRFDFVQFTGGVIIIQGKLDNFPDTLNFIFR